MASSYRIKETFRTVQGEGFHAGTPAFFIRFAGCNLWSGHDVHRARDAERNEAKCPLWCDTDFVDGVTMSRFDVKAMLEAQTPVPLIVLTGGEPLLQVDEALLDVIQDAAPEARIAIETNGTARPKFGYYERLVNDSTSCLWVTLSPKRTRDKTVLPVASELKLVWPEYEPAEWATYPARYRFVQPVADKTILQHDVERRAVDWVAGQYMWRLSLQTHKYLGVR